ncbi:MAG: hypothetical protein CMO81_11930 [Waddliaceae bacterium]|nr:hypothetical protein [Waddliaceae bacterium]
MVKDSKERLLDAGTKVFARDGFEGASTREIVKEAGVNISAIPYYFDSKDGLYEAIIRRIISIVFTEQGEKIREITKALERDDISQNKVRTFLHDLLRHFAGFLLSDKASPDMAQLMIREQMQPTPIFDIIYEGAMLPMHQTLARLISRLTQLPIDDEKVILCTHMIIGQLAVFKTHREMILRRSGWGKYSRKEAQKIIEMVLYNTDAIIAAHAQSYENGELS